MKKSVSGIDFFYQRDPSIATSIKEVCETPEGLC